MIGKIWNYFIPSTTIETELTKELSTLNLSGTLYLKKIGENLGQISEECSITLTVINEQNFEYNLNIHNDDYVEGSDIWEHMQFHITNELHFKVFKNTSGNDCLMWQRSLTFFVFEIFRDEDIVKTFPFFIDKLAELITSNDFQIDTKTASNEETKDQYIMNYGILDNLEKFIEDNYKNMKEEETFDDVINKMGEIKISSQKFTDICPNANNIFSSTQGSLHKYDQNSKSTNLISNNAIFKIYETGKFSYYIVVEENDLLLVYTKIQQESNILFNFDELNVLFLSLINIGKKTKIDAYDFEMTDANELKKLKNLIAKCHYESTNLMPYEDLNPEEKKNLECINEEIDEESLIDENNEFDFEKGNEYKDDTSQNKFSEQAYIHDRTFAFKENNKISMFKTDPDTDELIHTMDLPPVLDYDGNPINISKAKMYLSDTNMILQDKNNPKTLWQYDINTGKIIDEWKNDEDILDITQQKKFDQMNDNPIMYGINKNSVFILDGKESKKNKIVAKKKYKTMPNFSCIASTGYGDVAVANNQGELRLYNEIGKNPKTFFPCYSDPIRAIDTTKDGKYVLATCDKYLMLIKTQVNNKNGYQKSIANENRNIKTLRLTPKDLVNYNITFESFTPAKFDINNKNREKYITTSIGQYMVMWSLNDIKKGKLEKYKIKSVNEYIINNVNKFNKDQTVITMSKKLRIQNQKN